MSQLPSFLNDPALFPRKREPEKPTYDPAFEVEGSYDPAFEPEETKPGKTNQNRVGTLTPSHRDPVPLMTVHEPEPTGVAGQFLRDHPNVDSMLFGRTKQNSPELFQQRTDKLNADPSFKQLEQTDPQAAYRMMNDPKLYHGDEWLEIPGVQAGANWLADKIPFQEEDQIPANAAYVTRALGSFLAGGADPRAVGVRANPKGELFGGGVPNEAKFAGTNIRPPKQPLRISGLVDYGGETALPSITPKLPPPGGGAQQRFLASPSGVAPVRNTFPVAPEGPAGEFSPPLDPADTSAFPQTIISGARPTYYTPEEQQAIVDSQKNKLPPVIEPPRPITLGMSSGQGPQFGVPQGGEQLNLPVEMPKAEVNPFNPVIEPPAPKPTKFADPYLPKLDLGVASPTGELIVPPAESPVSPPDVSIAPSFQNPNRGKRPPVVTSPDKPRIRQTSQGEFVNPTTGEVLHVDDPDEPQEMRIPKYKEGNTGLDNVSMGGANRRTLDVLGSSLYSRPRPVTTIKELLQNAFDEHKEFGITEPVRVLIDDEAPNPITDGGEKGKSITVRDRGRGLMPEEIYGVLTNIGETGKAGVVSASGGFGFAKASPMLGGKHVKITSVVDTPEGRRRYTFQGTPEQMKPAEVPDDTRGVPLNEEKVDNTVPTGLEVTTFYDKGVAGFYQAADWAKNMTESSPSVESGILLAHEYGARPEHARQWLDETTENPIVRTHFNSIKPIERSYKPRPAPTLMDTVKTPGADVNIHYDTEPGKEVRSANIHFTNKGMYQGSDEISYGGATENVPDSIMADIIATVEEGHDDYPFGANREQVKDNITDAINKWVRDNIVSGVTRKRVAAVQRKYDNIEVLHPDGLTDIHYLDDGNLFTPEEIKTIAENPKFVEALRDMEDVHLKLMEMADSLGWSPEGYSNRGTWKYPSERLKKFGLLFQAPDANGTILGIHIPRPDDMNNSSILINVMEHLNLAIKHGDPIDQFTTKMLTTMIHEIAHIPGGGHDKNHSYRDAELHSIIGGKFTVDALDQLGRAFDDGHGNINDEISEVLRVYNDSRGRTKSSDDDLIKTGINSIRPPDSTRGKKGGTASGNNGGGQSQSNRFDRIPQPRPISVKPPKSEQKVDNTTPFEKVVVGGFNFVHGMKTIGDLGPVLRQGKNFAGRPFWWKALWQQFGSFASESSHKKFTAKAANHELIKAKMKYATHINGQKVGKAKQEPRSWAEFAGLHADIDLNTTTEEITAGLELAEKFFDKLTFGAVNPARASNRAYQDAMAIIRLGAANSLYSNYKKLYESLMKTAKTAEERAFAEKHNPDNIELAVKIADEVNQASGRSRLGIKEQSFLGGKVSWNKRDFEHEGLARGINLALFAPRYLKSNVDQIIKILDLPRKAAKGFFGKGKDAHHNRIMAVEHGKQLLSYAGITASLAFIYGVLLGGKNETDPRSSDYGKSRISNRITAEYSGGIGKYATLGARTATGESKTKRGRVVDLTSGNPVYGDVVDKFEDFAENQMSAPLALVMALANRKERYGSKDRGLNLTSPNPFENTITKTLVVPMTYQNLYDIMKEDPAYAPLIIGDALGAGLNVESK